MSQVYHSQLLSQTFFKFKMYHKIELGGPLSFVTCSIGFIGRNNCQRNLRYQLLRCRHSLNTALHRLTQSPRASQSTARRHHHHGSTPLNPNSFSKPPKRTLLPKHSKCATSRYQNSRYHLFTSPTIKLWNTADLDFVLTISEIVKFRFLFD